MKKRDEPRSTNSWLPTTLTPCFSNTPVMAWTSPRRSSHSTRRTCVLMSNARLISVLLLGTFSGGFCRPVGVVGAGCFQVIFHLGDDFRMLRGDIRFFADVVLEIVKFQRAINAEADALPITHANGLVESAFVEFPIQEFMFVGLRFSQQRGQE